jgi:mono/diheme cytochrome c family protein
MRSRLFLLLPLVVIAACMDRKEPPAVAEDKPAEAATPPAPAKPAPDSFAMEVQPFIQSHCLTCHNAKKEAGGLNLAAYTKTAEVIRDRETWDTVRQRLEGHEMPPKDRPRPAEADLKKVVAWIGRELDRAAKDAPKSPGRVTLRRLNRSEYNRTIRDLVGVDFHPADDFPTDDVGYGFDNIGDVLSLPPILLEKYLTAAEKIVGKAFEGEVPPADSRKYAAKELKTSDKAELGPAPRNPNSQIWTLQQTGSVYFDHNVPRDGEMLIRATVFAKPRGQDTNGDPVRMAVRLDGKEIANQRIGFNAPAPLEFKSTVKAGSHRIAVAFLNPSAKDTADDKKKSLFVGSVEVVNPPEAPKKPETYHRIMIGQKDAQTRERAREILNSFSKKAWRRPVARNEIDRLLKLYDLGQKQGESFDKSVELAIQAVLVSPHFLFRVEADRPADKPDNSYPLNDWEIASRLSYFLWSTMPDDELFRLAEQGKLRDPAVREAQVRRMVKDAKAFALVEDFGDQWLNLRLLQSVQPSKHEYLNYDQALNTAMRKETELFFENIMREDRSILEFLDADYTFVNERLAKHYGISGVTGEQFRKVKLTDRNRGGVLTQASVLTLTSNPTRTSPVKRGKWILENMLGAPPPNPPPDVPDLKEGDAALTGSLRQRMEQHRANPSCATCHEKMDPLGFGFENFDGIGAWRSKDGKFPIDASGELPNGQKFNGPAELKALLKSKEDQFRKCLAEKMLTFALGRGLESADKPTLEAISRAVAADGNRFSRLVVEIVQSDAFLRRVRK